MSKKGLCCLLMIIAALGVFALLPSATDLAQYLQTMFMDFGVWRFWCFLLLAVMFSVFAVPRQVISFVGGFIFEPVWGVFVATLGVTLGCAITFFAARSFLRPLAEAHLLPRYAKQINACNLFLSASPCVVAVGLRLFPSGSNWLTGIVAGLSEVQAWPFIAGSAMGYVPQNTIFVLLGAGMQLADTTLIYISVGLFCISVAITVFVLQKTPWGKKYLYFFNNSV